MPVSNTWSTYTPSNRELLREAIMGQVAVLNSEDFQTRLIALQQAVSNTLAVSNMFRSHIVSTYGSIPSVQQTPELQGAIFINDHILLDVTEETLTLFKDQAPSIYIFALTKAVFIFTLGSKSNDEIPDFFRQETKSCIEKQRKEFIKKHCEKCIVNELQESMTDLTKFEAGVKQEDGKVTLTLLQGIAYKEIHNGLLITKCLEKALSSPRWQ